MRRLGVAGAGLLVLAGVSPSLAADGDAIEVLIRHGVELRKGGDDQAARLEFKRAYEMGNTPRSAGQLGLCEQALGRWAEADQHLAEALEKASDPWIKKNRALLEKSLTLVKTHVGHVEIAGTPAGAEVMVNGHSVGRLPLADAIPVNAGLVDIEVRAAGHRPGTTTTQVLAGQTNSIVLRLEPEVAHGVAPAPFSPLAPAPTAGGAAPPPAAHANRSSASTSVVTAVAPVPLHESVASRAATPAGPGVDLRTQTDPPPSSEQAATAFYQKPWFWIAVGVGVATAVGVTIAIARAHTEYPSVQQMGTFTNPGN